MSHRLYTTHTAAASGEVTWRNERCDRMVLAFRLPGATSSPREMSRRLCWRGSVRWN